MMDKLTFLIENLTSEFLFIQPLYKLRERCYPIPGLSVNAKFANGIQSFKFINFQLSPKKGEKLSAMIYLSGMD